MISTDTQDSEAYREPHSEDCWIELQQEMVQLLEKELSEVLGRVHLVDVEWCTWRPLFTEARNARSAVDRAFERDL
jgi:hypothetical protein